MIDSTGNAPKRQDVLPSLVENLANASGYCNMSGVLKMRKDNISDVICDLHRHRRIHRIRTKLLLLSDLHLHDYEEANKAFLPQQDTCGLYSADEVHLLCVRRAQRGRRKYSSTTLRVILKTDFLYLICERIRHRYVLDEISFYAFLL